MQHKDLQVCTNTYITPEGKEVGCMGWMKFRKNDTQLYCDLCGNTIVLVDRKEGKL